MNISGIGTYAGLYDYNRIEAVEAPGQIPVVGTAVHADEVTDSSHQQADTAVRSQADTGAEAYADRYQPDAVYEMKGADSDINSLDVDRAISDMQRDQVLQQYQFFVGESQAQTGVMARPVEDFSL